MYLYRWSAFIMPIYNYLQIRVIMLPYWSTDCQFMIRVATFLKISSFSSFVSVSCSSFSSETILSDCQVKMHMFCWYNNKWFLRTVIETCYLRSLLRSPSRFQHLLRISYFPTEVNLTTQSLQNFWSTLCFLRIAIYQNISVLYSLFPIVVIEKL